MIAGQDIVAALADGVARLPAYDPDRRVSDRPVTVGQFLKWTPPREDPGGGPAGITHLRWTDLGPAALRRGKRPVRLEDSRPPRPPPAEGIEANCDFQHLVRLAVKWLRRRKVKVDLAERLGNWPLAEFEVLDSLNKQTAKDTGCWLSELFGMGWDCDPVNDLGAFSVWIPIWDYERLEEAAPVMEALDNASWRKATDGWSLPEEAVDICKKEGADDGAVARAFGRMVRTKKLEGLPEMWVKAVEAVKKWNNVIFYSDPNECMLELSGIDDWQVVVDLVKGAIEMQRGTADLVLAAGENCERVWLDFVKGVNGAIKKNPKLKAEKERVRVRARARA